jgi:hypothetical protein
MVNPSDSNAVGDMQLKISSSTILNATSASQIPTQTFSVSSMYKNGYIHLHQPTGTSCSWTSYVLCTGAIGNANVYYPVTLGQIAYVKQKCNNSISITKLRDFANNYDYNVVNCLLKATNDNSAGRFEIIKYMLAHLNSHHTPFVALALDEASGKGHYLVAWDIKWKVGGTGSTIYYTDPLDNNGDYYSKVRSVSLTTFLNWMRDNPNADYYNCLFLWEH